MRSLQLGLAVMCCYASALEVEEPSLVLENYQKITDVKTKRVFDQYLQDLFTMYRSFFEDNLDHCPECYTTFPRTGNDYKSVNKIDDDVYKVLQLASLKQPANITKQTYEFIVQLEDYIQAITPTQGEGSIDIKMEAMRLVTLGFYKSRHDLARANKIYKEMRYFDRKTRFRQSLITWFANGMGEEYAGVRDDLLKYGSELIHLCLRRREFNFDVNCMQVRERIKFLVEQSTLWIWQARGLVFSGRNSPLERQKIMMQGLAGTLIELAWYIADGVDLPILIEYSCNQNDQDIDFDNLDQYDSRSKRDDRGWAMKARQLPAQKGNSVAVMTLMKPEDLLTDRELEWLE